VLIILAFLLIPFHISLFLSKKNNSVKGNFKLKCIGLTIYKSPIPPKEKKEKKKEKKKKKDKDWDLERIEKVLNLIFDSWPHFYRILTSIMRSIHIEKLSVSLIFGLESPADTAIVTGYIWAFLESTRYLIPIPLNISINPDLDKKIMDGTLDFELKIRFIRIATEILRAFTKKPVRSLLWEMRG
jgi:hypothetical protein